MTNVDSTTTTATGELELEEAVVDGVAIRTYAAALTPGDGRTVDLRIIPYGERSVNNDGLGGVPRGVPYTEEMVAGVFDHQIKAANRILVDVEHEPGIAGVVGHGLALRSVPGDGFHGSFRIHETPSGDTALTLVREGVLAGASVECRFLKSIRGADGVVRRVKAQLNKVALCREPAYEGAIVLGVREAPIMLDEELLPKPFDSELASRISALGIRIPDRLVGHPETGTPGSPDGENGTPEPTPPDGDESLDPTEV